MVISNHFGQPEEDPGHVKRCSHLAKSNWGLQGSYSSELFCHHQTSKVRRRILQSKSMIEILELHETDKWRTRVQQFREWYDKIYNKKDKWTWKMKDDRKSWNKGYLSILKACQHQQKAEQILMRKPSHGRILVQPTSERTSYILQATLLARSSDGQSTDDAKARPRAVREVDWGCSPNLIVRGRRMKDCIVHTVIWIPCWRQSLQIIFLGNRMCKCKCILT